MCVTVFRFIYIYIYYFVGLGWKKSSYHGILPWQDALTVCINHQSWCSTGSERLLHHGFILRRVSGQTVISIPVLRPGEFSYTCNG